MKEVYGNLWNYWRKPNHVVCLTTNGFVKKDGNAVMGRGCAAEAVKRLPFLPGTLAKHIQQNGNKAGYLFLPDSTYGGIAAFPVKHNWFEKADLLLIAASTLWLHTQATLKPDWIFLLPRPGCGNGQLDYCDVRPLLVDLPNNVWVIDYAERPYWREQ